MIVATLTRQIDAIDKPTIGKPGRNILSARMTDGIAGNEIAILSERERTKDRGSSFSVNASIASRFRGSRGADE